MNKFRCLVITSDSEYGCYVFYDNFKYSNHYFTSFDDIDSILLEIYDDINDKRKGQG